MKRILLFLIMRLSRPFRSLLIFLHVISFSIKYLREKIMIARYSALGWWEKLPHFWRNVGVGVVAALFIHIFQNTSYVNNLSETGIDYMIRANADLERMSGRANGRKDLQFTFLDIDQRTFRKWGEPFHVPRGKLLDLIRFAAEGGARQIIVDVDLSAPGTVPRDDARLLAYLKRYEADAPPLFLMRVRRPPLPEESRAAATFKPTIADGIEKRNIFWAHPNFKMDSSDKKVRRWRLYVTGCLGQKPLVLPAVQLLSASIGGDNNVSSELYRALEKLNPKSCASASEEKIKSNEYIKFGNTNIKLGGISERIIYTMGWNKGDGTHASDLDIIPARVVTESEGPIANDSVSGRIVVIGASFAESHDIHDTPLGQMPGAMIILNAIKSFALFGQLQPPSWWIKLLLEISMIMIISFIFVMIKSKVTSVIATIVTLVILSPVSFLLFRFGIWVDFVVPLIAIEIYKILSKHEGERHKTNGKMNYAKLRNG